MSLCRIMVEDYLEPHGQPGYGRYDLEWGVDYARGLISEGYAREPFYGFNLKGFIEWATRKLEGGQKCNSHPRRRRL